MLIQSVHLTGSLCLVFLYFQPDLVAKIQFGISYFSDPHGSCIALFSDPFHVVMNDSFANTFVASANPGCTEIVGIGVFLQD